MVAPVPGDYRIRVITPAGASFTLKDQGADTADSDINPSGVGFGFTDSFNIAPNVISITRMDAGLINVQPSPTPSQTNTPTHTATPTNTPTHTATPKATKTPSTKYIHLPMVRR